MCSVYCQMPVMIQKYLVVLFLGFTAISALVLERTVRCSRTVRFFVMFDMFKVRFWAKMWCSEVFEVQSCCYVTRLVLEHTVWCSRTVQFFVMFNMFEVQSCYVTRLVLEHTVWCSRTVQFFVKFNMFKVRFDMSLKLFLTDMI